MLFVIFCFLLVAINSATDLQAPVFERTCLLQRSSRLDLVLETTEAVAMAHAVVNTTVQRADVSNNYGGLLLGQFEREDPVTGFHRVALILFVYTLFAEVVYRMNYSFPKEGQGAVIEAKTDRSMHMDNGKFLCLMFVVWNHWIGRFMRPCWFHMVLFSLLSGSATRPATKDRVIRFVALTVAPLMLFVCVLNPLLGNLVAFARGAGAHKILDDLNQFIWSGEVGHVLLISGYPNPIWYLRCVILCRLFAWMTDFLSAHMQLVLAILIGTAVATGTITPYSVDDQSGPFAAIRAATMGPFFFAGRCIDWKWLDLNIPSPSPLFLSVSWVILLAFLALYQIFQTSLDELIAVLEPWGPPFTVYKPSIQHPLARYWADLALRGFMAMSFFLCCVPRDRTFFSAAGTFSMYPYLLHGTFINILPVRGLWESTGQWPWLHAIFPFAWLLVAAALTVALASQRVQATCRWALQPDWLLRLVQGDAGVAK